MSGIQVLGLVLSAVPLALKILASAGAPYRNVRFGFVWGFILRNLSLVDTDLLQQRHWDINVWTDEEVKSWKESHLASCNAIAVAGAIFASSGLTALQIPDMYAVHWSTRACCVASMVLGVFSVTTATKQHQIMGMLKSPLDVRLWLSSGKPTPRPQAPKGPKGHNAEPVPKYGALEDFQRLPLESSTSSLKTVALPRHLLDMAVALFIIGIGLYELFGWRSNAGNNNSDAETDSSRAEEYRPNAADGGLGYRNVSIVLMATSGLTAIYDITVSTARVIDDDKRNKEFGANRLGGFHGPEELQELEEVVSRSYRNDRF